MTRHKRRALSLLAVFGIAFFLLLYHKYLFFSHTLEITVLRNGAVEECYPRRTLLFGEKRRSSAPEPGPGSFCGAILTNRGHYELPRSSEYWGIHQGRGYLKRNLIEGCRYEVTIVGYGDRFEKGDKPRYPIRQRITWINRRLGCVD